jgi:hypothetical protein
MSPWPYTTELILIGVLSPASRRQTGFISVEMKGKSLLCVTTCNIRRTSAPGLTSSTVNDFQILFSEISSPVV